MQPTAAGITNPVDLIASADGAAYLDTIVKLLAADDVDAVMAIYTTIDSARTDEMLTGITNGVAEGAAPGCHAQAGRRLHDGVGEHGAAARGRQKSCRSTSSPNRRHVRSRKPQRTRHGGPRHLARSCRSRTCALREARNLCRDIVRTRGESWLTTQELQQLLHAADLQLAPSVLAHSADEAAALARVFGYPVVAKLASPKAVHKTEVGGVRLHLGNEHAVRTAYAELCATASNTLGGSLEGILIQPMVTNGTETLIGLTQDPMFGPLVAFGLGGTQVELFRDVAFRIAPLTDRDADEMIRSVRGFPLLQGYRNKPPADLARPPRRALEGVVSGRADSRARRARVQPRHGDARRSRLPDCGRAGACKEHFELIDARSEN